MVVLFSIIETFACMKKNRIVPLTAALYFIYCTFGSNYAFAQKQLNFGLTKPQPFESLPKGKEPLQQAEKKPRSGQAGKAILKGNSLYAIDNGWELTDDVTKIITTSGLFNEQVNTKGWNDAVVPGTILTSLVAAGVYPDPYFGLNNLAITDSLCRKEWWYRTTFETPGGENDKLAWLTFNAINYKSRVWINGHYLGEMSGAFIRGMFRVDAYLKKSGKNVLLVQILPPNNPGIPDEQSAVSGMGKNGGVHTMDGPVFFSTEGWDWIPGIRDRNMGIWQDVTLHFTGNVTSADPQVITNLPLPDTTTATVAFKTTITNNSNSAQQATVTFSFEGVEVSKKISLLPKQVLPVSFTAKEFAALTLNNPKLWWPNGYGTPHLYHAAVTVSDANGIADTKQFRFGVREYSYELMANTPASKPIRFAYSPSDIPQQQPLFDFAKRTEFGNKIFIPSFTGPVPTQYIEPLNDNTNPHLVIRVNGKPVYCKGGNWGIDDAMKKISREQLEPAFRLHKEANFNMIRNWTGQCTESTFFELADEYGMMVWNDFWISTEGFNLNPADQQLFLANSLDVIKRYRNHASIAVWCPRNEGYAPVGIETELATQIAVEDGTRHYHGNSRDINLRPSGPWHFFENNTDYFTKQGKGFTTEIGTFSVPEASTIRKFIAPKDQWPINDVWHYHDLHINNQNLEGYLKNIDSLYGPSNNLDDFNRKVQLVNYESHRAIFEAWNSNLWKNSSGVLLWMSHPAWPSMIWQTYSWDFQTHGSYYGSKKGCEPLHIQMNLHNNEVMIVNTSLQSVQNVVAGMQVFTAEGKMIQTQSLAVNIAANEKASLFTPSLNIESLPANYMVRLFVKDKKGNVLASNDYWKSNAATGNYKNFNQLPVVNISTRATRLSNGQIKIELENKTKTAAIGVKLDAMDKQNEILLPAYFSDGYFTLLPKEKRIVLLDVNNKEAVAKIKLSGYNLSGEVVIQ
jgi:Exo-beta-D-glucosaminidase Ig-fold domain/Glycosyl hydrolases family 2/Glycosyl hydrolases family 2, sugar binding domain/Glycosyl hydrolases family 2, TIM barrel domain